MSTFTGTDASEVITPAFVSGTVVVTGTPPRPSDEADIIDAGGGDDTVDAGGGNDTIRGGLGADLLSGGDGDDRFVWNPGDGSDVVEGGIGIDTAEVNGGDDAELFTVTANGTRVRLDRLEPAPFNLDIGTTEHLAIDLGGGDDKFSATGNLAALIQITVDGGAGDDTILGSNGADTLLGGGDNDFIDGQQGNDTAFLGAGDDVFQWDPGDGSDTVEGGTGSDTLRFNGSAGNEIIAVAANGGRASLTRNLGNIAMDLDDVEKIEVRAVGGTDAIIVNDLTGTEVGEVAIDLAGILGGTAGDGQADTVTVNGTGGSDAVTLTASGSTVVVNGLAARVTVDHAEAASDRLVVNGLGGNDTIDASAAPAGQIGFTLDGGAGNDVLTGGGGSDVFLGGDGNDVIDGNQGNDVALLGAGNDVFTWNPGDGNDTVEGGVGSDTLRFGGSGANENVDIVANGGRAVLFRDVANVTMDLNDVERIEIEALAGQDRINVGDLTGTDVTQVMIDLEGVPGSRTGDGQPDVVTVNGSGGANAIKAFMSGNTVVVSGLPAQVRIDRAEAGDQLVINGGTGDDTINAGGIAAGKIGLQLNGGLGIDTITGGQGDDLITGGDGNDKAFMGAGNDVFVWNPGDDNDTVEGGAGSDALRFNGSGAGEAIAISANGGRAALTRDVANVVMDLNDIERIELAALGGADTLTVNDLFGTEVSEVAIDLAGLLGGTAGDGQADTVTVNGSAGNDTITVALSGGAVAVSGLAAEVTVDHGEAGNDQLVVDGQAGNDRIDASAAPAGQMKLVLAGGIGNDTVLGGQGADILRGGGDDDVLTGGAGDDQVFGDDGDDRMVWSAGDGSDVMEGGVGTDTAEVNGYDGAEVFTITANGARVRVDRLDPAPSNLDIGTTERLVVNLGGGNDTISATGNLAALTGITIDGGAGDDIILGSNGADTLLGGADRDFIDGQQGNDTAFLGAGDDVFQWDPGDGNDTVEGGAGFDVLWFNGNAANEAIAISANGGRAALTRDVAGITMDLNDVERIEAIARGGTDSITVGDLTGTEVTEVAIKLASPIGGVGDGQADSVTVNGTGGGDVITVTSEVARVTVTGLAAKVTVDHPEAIDRLVVRGLDGDDVIDASAMPAGQIGLVLDGGLGDDVLIGGGGSDLLAMWDGQDRAVYDDILDAGDILTGFSDAGADQDFVDLDALFDALDGGIASAERAARVQLTQLAEGVELKIDTGALDGADMVSLLVFSGVTASAIGLTVGTGSGDDIQVGTL